MDADQLAVALARAVEASKPAAEYCLLWIDWWPMCMTKAEWSGWMQAIGSVLAIAASVAVVQYQITQERRTREVAAANRVISFAGMLELLCAELTNLTFVNSDLLRMRRSVLEEWIQDARQIGFEDLSVEWTNVLHMMRASTIQIIQFLKQGELKLSESMADVDLSLVVIRFLKHDLGECAKDVATQVKLLRTHSYKPPKWKVQGPKVS